MIEPGYIINEKEDNNLQIFYVVRWIMQQGWQFLNHFFTKIKYWEFFARSYLFIQ